MKRILKVLSNGKRKLIDEEGIRMISEEEKGTIIYFHSGASMNCDNTYEDLLNQLEQE